MPECSNAQLYRIDFSQCIIMAKDVTTLVGAVDDHV